MKNEVHIHFLALRSWVGPMPPFLSFFFYWRLSFYDVG